MFAYLKTLPPDDRAQEIAQIEAMLQEDPTALVPLYRDAALQNTSREASSQMVLSITGVTVGAIFAGAFIGFPLALTAGTLFLAQQFWNSQKQKREARWAIEDGEDFTRFLDQEAQREYRHFAAAVKGTSGHVLPHSEPVIDVKPITATADTFNLAESLATANLAECKSLLVMGEPGVGKGLFIETWKNALLAAHPGAILYAVNPKPDQRESHRWQGFKSVLNVTNESEASHALAALHKIEDALKVRLSQPSDIPFALVIDEYNTLSDLWSHEERDQATKLIKRIARQGRSLRCRLLLALHSPNADELGMTASDRACFTAVALGFKNNQAVLRLAAGNHFLFPGLPKGVMEAIQSLKGQPVAVALCSEYDRMLRLPTWAESTPAITDDLFADIGSESIQSELKAPPVQPAPTDKERLEVLFNRGNEEAVKSDLVSVFEFIASFLPHVGDKLTARQLYKSEKAKDYSITSENADNLLKQIAEAKSHCFEYGEETNKFGSVSRFLLRVERDS